MKPQSIFKRCVLIVMDLLIMLLCGMVSSWLVTGTPDSINFVSLFLCTAITLLVLFCIGFYRIRLANSSLEVVGKAAIAMMVSSVVVLVVVGYLRGFMGTSFRWVIVFYTTSLVVILASRVIYRVMVSQNPYIVDRPSAIVYGAGELGSTMARMSNKGKFDFNVIGFIDDDLGLAKELIVNRPVYGGLDSLEYSLRKTGADALIIAVTRLPSEKIQRAVEIATNMGCKVKIVPNLFEVKGRSDVTIRDIDYSDLLGRALDKVDVAPLHEMFNGKKILVTGAGGSIGSEISKQILCYNPSQLIVLDIDETELHDLSLRLLNYEREWSDKVIPVVCDIRNRKKLDAMIAKYAPDIVFHAAAYKHVPLMELFPEEAIINNIYGSYNLFNACVAHSVGKVVVISTDKAVNPTNVMGATKRVVELLASSFNSDSTEFCCVRFGNVIGSRGSMLPLFLEQIKAGKPITVTDKNIIRYFMAIPEAVSLVFRAATIANGGEVMVLDMGKPVRIYDFAQKLISIYGDEKSSIKITGLRPGEKLYEELLADKDNTIPTESERIFKAKVIKDERFTSDFVTDLVAKIPSMDSDSLVRLLHELVPEFVKKQ